MKGPATTIAVGIGQTEYCWKSGRPEAALAAEAIELALADAGLDVSDVDGMVRFAGESTAPTELVSRLGIAPLSFAAEDGYGGGTACGLIGLADAAIRTRRARVVVAYRAFNARSQIRLGQAPPSVVVRDGERMRAVGPSPSGEFGAPYGLAAPAHVFALWTSAYMHRFGVAAERMQAALGTVVVTARAHAARNPSALLRDKPLSLEGYFAEPILAEPLRRADLCLESDGACALVFCAREVGADCRQPPVRVLGATQAVISGYHDMFLTTPELPPRPLPGTIPEFLAAHGLAVGDLDVIATYDACSANVVFDVETLGLCAMGEGVDWVRSPSVPVNPSGGLLAEVYLQGMNHLVDVVRQLRGSATTQVEGAEVALATSQAVSAAALFARGAGS